MYYLVKKYRAFSIQKITQYNGSGLVLDYSFHTGFGDVSFDESGSANHGNYIRSHMGTSSLMVVQIHMQTILTLMHK